MYIPTLNTVNSVQVEINQLQMLIAKVALFPFYEAKDVFCRFLGSSSIIKRSVGKKKKKTKIFFSMNPVKKCVVLFGKN